jgi:hypothetical protein
MTIYEIKKRTQENEPYFFSRAAMKFFGQTLKDFKVQKQPDGRYKISALIGKHHHSDLTEGYRFGWQTVRFFNPELNTLEEE